jgi:hypothetical protein
MNKCRVKGLRPEKRGGSFFQYYKGYFYVIGLGFQFCLMI